MKRVTVEEAVGQRLIHDIARIVIGEVKDTPFRRGDVIRPEDIDALRDVGKEHVYIMEPGDEDLIHEEDVAQALYNLCASEYVRQGEVREGKIEAFSTVDGVLVVDVPQVHAINSIGELNVVTKFTHTVVEAGSKLAGMRCVPLLLEAWQVEKARELHDSEFGGRPILEVKPFLRKKLGIVTTGTEVYEGRIQDAFTPIILERLAPMGVELVAQEKVPDDTDRIVEAIAKVKAAGADLILCTGGMSVDPDDLTPGAIMRSCERLITYGLPVLPGSMVCISYMADGTPLLGIPGGVLFSKPTAFDCILPRAICNIPITKEDCIALGHGGLL